MQFLEVFGCVLIVAEPTGLTVERCFRSQPVRVVHQMPQNAAVVGIMDVAVCQLRLTLTTGRRETPPVATRSCRFSRTTYRCSARNWRGNLPAWPGRARDPSRDPQAPTRRVCCRYCHEVCSNIHKRSSVDQIYQPELLHAVLRSLNCCDSAFHAESRRHTFTEQQQPLAPQPHCGSSAFRRTRASRPAHPRW